MKQWWPKSSHIQLEQRPSSLAQPISNVDDIAERILVLLPSLQHIMITFLVGGKQPRFYWAVDAMQIRTGDVHKGQKVMDAVGLGCNYDVSYW